MTRRAWTARERALLRRHYRRLGPRGCARLLRRSTHSIAHQARQTGLQTLRFLSEADEQFIRQHYRKLPTAQIARRLGRHVDSIYNAAFRLGLMTKRPQRDSREVERFLRRYHRQGWSDNEIAALWREQHPGDSMDRHFMGELRSKLGLPHNAYSKHRRQRVAQKSQEQLRKAGLRSMGEIRQRAFAEFCRRRGWPQIQRPRAAQILDALYTYGPMTRRQLARAIGMPWKGSRKSLTSNDERGSYLAHLMARGLVVTLGRQHQVLGRGKGKSCHVYAIPPGVRRQLPA